MAQDDDGRTLVYSYDYYPNQDFDVLAQLETGTTVSMLETAEGETVSEISQPDDYTGHVVRYDMDGFAGLTGFVFLRDESLESGDSSSLGTEASMFSPELNLLEVSRD